MENRKFTDSILSDRPFELLKKFIYDNTGIYYQDNKRSLLESRIKKRLTSLKIETYEEYFQYLKKNKNENKTFIDAITVKETYFFRNPNQLEAITSVIAELYEGGNHNIKIWSAACSSGEEPYTIAISILENLKPKYPFLNYSIIGTDISNKLIEKSIKGNFNKYSLRNTPPDIIQKYFNKDGRYYQIADKIKLLCEFKMVNLYDDKEICKMKNFDLIICSNVLIYFDLNSKIKVLSNLYKSLNKKGYLFMGRSETLSELPNKFKMISFPRYIAYKKN